VRDVGSGDRVQDPAGTAHAELLEEVEVVRGLEAPGEVDHRVCSREGLAQGPGGRLIGQVDRPP
jgi:hypothetical protein